MMVNLTTAKGAEALEAKERLLAWCPKGATVYCILRHVSRSGMMRVIQLYALAERNGQPYMTHLGWNAAKLLGYTFDDNRDGIKITGCGMDMGFKLVYDLAQALHGDGYALEHKWL